MGAIGVVSQRLAQLAFRVGSASRRSGVQFNRDERKRFERRLLDLMASVKDERGHALAVLLAIKE